MYLLKDFFKYRKQMVVLNGQNSSWKGITSGFPHGSILGPLLSLIYINACRMAFRQITNCLQIKRPFSLLFMMSL